MVLRIWAYLILNFASFWLPQTLAQTVVNNLPFTTRISLRPSELAIFNVPASVINEQDDEEGDMFVSLSLCSPPTGLDAANLPEINLINLQGLNSSGSTPGIEPYLSLGYAALTVPFQTMIQSTDGAVVSFQAPEVNVPTSGTWDFSLTLSQNFSRITVDDHPGLSYDDSDNTTALFTSPNYTTPDVTSSPPPYQLLLQPTIADVTIASRLSRSYCAIQNSTSLIEQSNIEISTTSRGIGGGERQQFLVNGLAPGTNYTAWLIEEATGPGGYVRFYQPTMFRTKRALNCRLVFDLDFCPNVAYSTPAPPLLSTAELVGFLEDEITPIIENFNRTTQFFSCDNLEMGAYSFIATCEGCRSSYRDWTCAAKIPRCDDILGPTVEQEKQMETLENSEWFIPQNFQHTIFRNNPNASRTPLFAEDTITETFPELANLTGVDPSELSPFPYNEVPPCLNLCHITAAQCPPFIDFRCSYEGEEERGTSTGAYGLPQRVELDDRIGDWEASQGGKTNEGMKRAQDRFGNVFCNSLGSDIKAAMQFTHTGNAGTAIGVNRFWWSVVLFAVYSVYR